jgi:hypothetical protein
MIIRSWIVTLPCGAPAVINAKVGSRRVLSRFTAVQPLELTTLVRRIRSLAFHVQVGFAIRLYRAMSRNGVVQRSTSEITFSRRPNSQSCAITRRLDYSRQSTWYDLLSYQGDLPWAA